MIIGKIHPGSGLGDQLFSYIVTRVIALDKGYEFGFIGKEFFKGKDFLNLDWGKEVECEYEIQQPAGKLVITLPWPENTLPIFEINKPYYDPEVNFIEDGTIIDGYGAQDLRYFEHRLPEIKEWLGIRSNFSDHKNDDNVCVINMRGGEYRAVPELFLPKEYWDKAFDTMFDENNNLTAEIHTDDLLLAKEVFPTFKAFRDIELNWRSLRYAKHAIISNSAFAIIPRLLKHLEDPEAVTIAPRYWNRYNLKRWDWPMNYYKQFTHIE